MNLKRIVIRRDKNVCLECQTYVLNCKAGCSGKNRFSVSTTFRPPKVGSSKWKLIEKLIRKNVYEVKKSDTDIVGSASFSRNTWFYRDYRGRRAKSRPSKMLRERGYIEYRLKTSRSYIG